jgi:phosphoenolpyruvate synthase/pyruvate phosphate dikinase
MRADYPRIVSDFESGRLTHDLTDKLAILLQRIGNKPMIVRSSSLLEDNFGTAFAGKYESSREPGNPGKFTGLTRAIGRVYASGLNPNALLYRRQRIADYDERMAIPYPVVQGNGWVIITCACSRVAFSAILIAGCDPHEDGFVRLVWGLGTRAVDRVGNDFPRLVALSHPQLRPSSDPNAIRRYSQHYVDLIDLDKNSFASLPIHDVLSTNYPPLRFIAQQDQDGYFSSLRSLMFLQIHGTWY